MDIVASENIQAGEYMFAGEDINCRDGNVVAGASITSKGAIKAGRAIGAGRNLEAGTGIEACEGYVRANMDVSTTCGSIKAGEGIHAGSNLFAGAHIEADKMNVLTANSGIHVGRNVEAGGTVSSPLSPVLAGLSFGKANPDAGVVKCARLVGGMGRGRMEIAVAPRETALTPPSASPAAPTWDKQVVAPSRLVVREVAVPGTVGAMDPNRFGGGYRPIAPPPAFSPELAPSGSIPGTVGAMNPNRFYGGHALRPLRDPAPSVTQEVSR